MIMLTKLYGCVSSAYSLRSQPRAREPPSDKMQPRMLIGSLQFLQPPDD